LRIVAFTAAVLAALVVGPAIGLADESASGTLASSSLEGSLAGPPVQPLLGSEAVVDAEEARLASPGAVLAREESQMKYEGLGAEQAGQLAEEAYPGVIDVPAGGPPALPAGDAYGAFIGANAAQVELASGGSAVVESFVPIATESSVGQWAPVDLSVSEAGGSFALANPDVPVSIPKQIQDGVGIPGSGVSLTPVDGSGSAVGGSEGRVLGAAVFYGGVGVGSDVDVAVQPTATGFETQTFLRSDRSPDELSFRVGMPQGASLVQPAGESGAVNVVANGSVLASIVAPAAEDAAGTPVPVSMSVSGDVLVLRVALGSTSVQYPVRVDPDVNLTGAGHPTHWKFALGTGSTHFRATGWGGSSVALESTGTYVATEVGWLNYEAERNASLIGVSATANGHNWGKMETYLQLSDGAKPAVTALFAGPEQEFSHEGAVSISDMPLDNFAHFAENATGGGSAPNTATVTKASVTVGQLHSPTVFFAAGLKEVGGREDVLYTEKPGWLGKYNGAFQVNASDDGVGVSELRFSESAGGKFGKWKVTRSLLEENLCEGVWCPAELKEIYTYPETNPPADGEDLLEIKALDASGASTFTETTFVKVDGTPPSGLNLTGLPANGVINEGVFHLVGRATDGTKPTVSSGIKSLKVGVDGYTIPGKGGSCTPGPCSVTGEWTFNGERLGAGKHTLTLVATDYANNVEKKEYSVVVRHSGSLSVGPGAVNPVTGALSLGASDVSIGAGQGALSVARSFNSRQLTAGEEGPLGPQWKLSVSGAEEIEALEGSVTLVSPAGRTTFVSDGKGGFVSPVGDENLVLEAEKKAEVVVAYLLKDPAAGTTVRFTQPAGSTSASPWVMSSTEGVLSKVNGEKEALVWERLEVEGRKINEPKLALATAPGGVTCSAEVKVPTELAAGCRALSFTYATKTSATGEAASEWGEYNGRLKTVSFTAYSTSAKKMETKAVAEYSYDKQGRLRAEWDPRLATALKSTYGYDAEGHVVAVDPPGEQPALLRYGTTTGDAGTGRLLSVTRPPATKHSEAQEQSEVKEADARPAPANTVLPTLSSTTPVIGTTLSVASNGTWSNGPLAYSDSWEDCYTLESKETCIVIPGAVNSSYTPQARDAGYTLRAVVTAVNGDGATAAASAASKAIAETVPAYLRKFGEAGEGEKGLKAPASAATDAAGNVWFVDRGNNRVQEWSATGTWLHTFGTKGTGNLQFEAPEGIAINQSTGNVYVADKGNNRVEELNSKGEFLRTFASKGSEVGQLKTPEGIAITPSGEVWVGDTGNNRVDEFNETGEYVGTFGAKGAGSGQFEGPDGVAFSAGEVYVVDSGNARVEEFSMSGEYLAKFATKGAGEAQLEKPTGIVTEPVSGDLAVTDTGNSRIEEFNPSGAFVLTVGKKGAGNGEYNEPGAVAITGAGYIYVPDGLNNRVQELEPKYSTNNPLPEPPSLGASAVSTIDYNVPVSGAGAPREMSKAELETWAQSDDPTEATAIFPPDEPMGWPAKNYTRATITYLDEFGRVVNRATPSGAIATSEYNATNEVVRALSADNRVAALKAGNPKAVALQLDTESNYNKDGTRLESTLGPEHLVKLSNGAEKQARNHVKYFYDEGAPEGETYNLVTKTTDGAVYEGKESDIRTTNTSYSGQEGLGWLLRKPTSTITDPRNALKGTFEEAFGTKGSESGQLKIPDGVALASNGNLWVADTGNNRVEEFSPTGAFILKFPAETKAGSGNGEFKAPEGIAVGSNGDIYVADTGNNRIQAFNSEGKYLFQFGQTGSEEQKLRAPAGVAVAPNGKVYVIDSYTEEFEKPHAVYEFSETGTFVRSFGAGSKGISCEESYSLLNAHGIAVAASGNVYVANTGIGTFGCDSVVEFSSEGAPIRDFAGPGKANGDLKEPRGVGIAANGNVYVADSENNRVQEFSEGGMYLSQFGTVGSENGQFKKPSGLAVTANGEVYVADTNNSRIEKWGGFSTGLNLVHATIYNPDTGQVVETRSPEAGDGTAPGTAGFSFKNAIGSEGVGAAEFKEPAGVAAGSSGNVYVADQRNNRVEEFTANGEYITQFGKKGHGNGEFEEPKGVAVAANGNVYVVDSGNYRVQKFSPTGEYLAQFGKLGAGEGQFAQGVSDLALAPSGNVYVSDYGNHRVEIFSASGEYLKKQFGSEGSGNGQFSVGPKGIAVAPNGDVYVVDRGHDRIEEFTATGEYLAQFGSESGTGTIQFHQPWDIAIAANGNVLVTDTSLKHVQETSASGANLGTFGSEGSESGQFKSLYGLAVGPNGNVYVADGGNDRLQIWTATNRANDDQTIYYSAEANTAYPSCGEHPEWAELPCQSQPAAQPATPNLPELPIVTDTYNFWDEPETVIETIAKKEGTATRTKTVGYDNAGRPITNEEATTGTTATAVPKVTSEYSAGSGVMVRQSSTSREIKSAYNTLGELTEYTDADGNKTTYLYTLDGQAEKMAYSIGAEEFSQSYTYDPTTAMLTKLVDSTAGTFTAGYDAEGMMTSEGYPNGMSAKHTLNATGETTGIEYEKTTHCTSSCVWFKETTATSIHGDAIARSSSLAAEQYTLDNAGRLTQVQETLTGKGCATRAYAYNEDSDRLSLTTYQANEKGECATASGKTENHSYDTADRTTDAGMSYETLGNITNVPAADAGEHEIIATFYSDNQTHTQTQNGEKITYNLDPAGRTRETISAGTTNSTVVDHYPGGSSAISWTSEAEAKWTRNIPGIDGSLSAIQHSGKTPELQLQDLQGNIIATAALSETETKLLTTYNPTEFGVPVNGAPPKYSWLGATGLATELTSGATTSGGTGYVPQLGEALQTEPITPPNIPPSVVGPYTSTISGESITEGTAHGAAAPAREAARLQAKQEEWERLHPPTPPGITPSPGEGGANELIGEGEVDPRGILWWRATDQLAAKFILWAKEIENGISTFEDQTLYGIEGTIEYMYNRAEELYLAAGQLKSCANKVKRERPHGVCYIEYTHAKQGSLAMGLFDDITQFDYEPCTWFEGHEAKHEWFTCPGTREKWWEG
jgi:DNA-binding beta-propeller fold protein YncE